MTTAPGHLVPHDHPALPGHFPGRPVVPGVLILEAVIEAAPVEVTGVHSAKFLRPLAPNTHFHIDGEQTPAGRWRFRVRGDNGEEFVRGELECASP